MLLCNFLCRVTHPLERLCPIFFCEFFVDKEALCWAPVFVSLLAQSKHKKYFITEDPKYKILTLTTDVGPETARTSVNVDPTTITLDPAVTPDSFKDFSSLARPLTITFCIPGGTPVTWTKSNKMGKSFDLEQCANCGTYLLLCVNVL